MLRPQKETVAANMKFVLDQISIQDTMTDKLMVRQWPLANATEDKIIAVFVVLCYFPICLYIIVIWIIP